MEAGIIDSWPLRTATVKLETLTAYWQKFSGKHGKMLSSKVDVTEEYAYFTDGSFDNTLKLFEAAQDALLQRISELEAALP